MINLIKIFKSVAKWTCRKICLTRTAESITNCPTTKTNTTPLVSAGKNHVDFVILSKMTVRIGEINSSPSYLHLVSTNYAEISNSTPSFAVEDGKITFKTFKMASKRGLRYPTIQCGLLQHHSSLTLLRYVRCQNLRSAAEISSIMRQWLCKTHFL